MQYSVSVNCPGTVHSSPKFQHIIPKASHLHLLFFLPSIISLLPLSLFSPSPFSLKSSENFSSVSSNQSLFYHINTSLQRSMQNLKMEMSPLLIILVLVHLIAGGYGSDLVPGYYSSTCPKAESIVRQVMKTAMAREARSGASVMRLQFHDCFVNGCDGSLLLDDTPTMLGEKLSLSNINSLRSYEVIDEIKQALEEACPGVVSCADIIIMASRDAVALSGGPDWEVKLGRLDSLTASQEDSDNIMPSPRANATYLINLFARFNLSVEDMVALSGSHSIGQGRCFSIVFRLYNQSGTGRPDPAIDPLFRRDLNKLCPLGGDGNVTGNLDATPTLFDNQYFKDLVAGRGFLNSDETLFTTQETRSWVLKFSRDQQAFFDAFVKGMIRMGDLQSGRPGEIRKNCRIVNNPPSKFDMKWMAY